jgi:hypothetical protein
MLFVNQCFCIAGIVADEGRFDAGYDERVLYMESRLARMLPRSQSGIEDEEVCWRLAYAVGRCGLGQKSCTLHEVCNSSAALYGKAAQR